MILEPINISVVAPTGAGKTALISTICDYIKKNSNKAKGFTIKITNSAAEELNNFATNLSGQLASKNMNFNSGLIKGTTECTEYEFSIVFTDRKTNVEVAQPFKILDIPGAFINNPSKYEDDSEYKKFISHLDQSRILWIPVDAAVMMEAVSDNQKGYSAIIRRVSNLEDFILEWSDFAAENDTIDYCNFVLVKSESYFSQDFDKKYNCCINQFNESYGPLIEKIKERNTQDKLSCVAVETIGSIKVNSAKWDPKDHSCKVDYEVCDTQRNIRGADCLLNDAMKVAKENIQKHIDVIKACKQDEVSKFDAQKRELIEEHRRKINQLEQIKNTLSNDLYKLNEQKRELSEKGWWDKFSNLWNDNIDKLEERIRRTEATIESKGDQIDREKDKLEYIERNVDFAHQNLQNAQEQLASFNSLLSQLNNLGIKDINTVYYRSL